MMLIDVFKIPVLISLGMATIIATSIFSPCAKTREGQQPLRLRTPRHADLKDDHGKENAIFDLVLCLRLARGASSAQRVGRRHQLSAPIPYSGIPDLGPRKVRSRISLSPNNQIHGTFKAPVDGEVVS
ncbi:MAG: hypothetical protein IPM05_12370 [Propionivibrio sp.]|nr:hypothetical protein [Propionivibrio sp.]